MNLSPTKSAAVRFILNDVRVFKLIIHKEPIRNVNTYNFQGILFGGTLTCNNHVTTMEQKSNEIFNESVHVR